MMLPEFKVLTVKNKEEAVAALAGPGGAKVVAGGTDLLVKMQKGESWDLLVDVSGASEMKRIDRDGSVIHIGGGVTHRRISEDNTLKDAAASLAYACSQVGSPQIRNMGTIGGNLVNASPAADSLPPLLIHDAVIMLESAVPSGSSRTVNLDDFIVSPYKTTIRDNELLTQISVGSLAGYREGYRRVAKRSTWAIARLSIAWAVLEDKGSFRDVKLAIGSCTPMPFRARAAEEFLSNKDKSKTVITEAINIVLEGIRSMSGERPSYVYKFPVLRGMLENILRG